MFAKIFVVVCALSAVLAYPAEYSPYAEYAEVPALQNGEQYALDVEPQPLIVQRVKRQFNLSGGGSSGSGFDINASGSVPVWQSGNGRHQLDALGSYSQHLGGPYGSSKPNFGAGVGYTFHF